MPGSSKILSLFGLTLSMYAVYVEYKTHHLQQDEEFSSLCDIEALNASCSAVFALPVGKMLSYFGIVPKDSLLDVPNAALGILYYTWHLLLSPYDQLQPLTDFFTVAAFGSSVFLAYQLTFVIAELCVLCWSTHVINSILLYRFWTRPAIVKDNKVKRV